jgi:hypothetical protein
LFKKQVKYVYLNIDKRLSPKCINYYYEHLTKARDMGFPSLYDWLVATYAENRVSNAHRFYIGGRSAHNWTLVKMCGNPDQSPAVAQTM